MNINSEITLESLEILNKELIMIINNLNNHINLLVIDQIISEKNYYELIDKLKEYNNDIKNNKDLIKDFILEKEFNINDDNNLININNKTNLIKIELLKIIYEYGYNSLSEALKLILPNNIINLYYENIIDKINNINNYFSIVKINSAIIVYKDKINFRIINLDKKNNNKNNEDNNEDNNDENKDKINNENIIENNILNLIWELNKVLIELEIDDIKYNIYGYFKEDILNDYRCNPLFEDKYKSIIKYYNNHNNFKLNYNCFIREYLNQLSIKDYLLKDKDEIILEINYYFSVFNKITKLNLIEIINLIIEENIYEKRIIIILLLINDIDSTSFLDENENLKKNKFEKITEKSLLKYPIIGNLESNSLVKMNKTTAINYTINSIKKNFDSTKEFKNINTFIYNSNKILNANILLDFLKKNILSLEEFTTLKKSIHNNIRRRIFIKEITEYDNNKKIDELTYEMKLDLLDLNEKTKQKVNEKIKEFRSTKDNSKPETYLDGFFRIPFCKYIKEDIFQQCDKSNKQISEYIVILNKYIYDELYEDDSIEILNKKLINCHLFDDNNLVKNLIEEKKNNNNLKIEYLKYVEKTLDDVIYGQYDSKREIKRIIAQWMNGSGNNDGVILGFHGPPGVGKTCFAKKGISKCLIDINNNPRPFSIFQLGGASDGNVLEGHNYTYVGSKWGRLVDILMDSKCMNPIIYFDELDKVSETDKGKEIIDILIHLTDKSQNSQIYDRYFSGIDLDFSKCIIIFSYNDSNKINKILKDRITEIKINALKKNEKVIITQKFTLKNISKDLNFKCELDKKVIEYLIDTYTYEAGIRKLNEKLYEIFREINLRKLENNFNKNNIDEDLIDEILNRHHKIKNKMIHINPKIGLINGLYASAIGLGGITLIQVKKILTNSSNIPLELTGQQGDVMKESMSCAKTLAISLLNSDENKKLLLELSTQQFGLHIHCPDTATPKDGPSAGLAITCAIYSILTSKPIRNDIAITGEVDLLGNAKEIGGLEAKINGAIKAGVKLVIFPKENEQDYLKIMDKKLLDGFIECKIIENIHELIEIAIIQ